MSKYHSEITPRDTYYSKYKLLIEYNLQDSLFLGDRKRRFCLFCGNTYESNKDKFKKVSHAISKAFKSNLKNYNECDECNASFQKYENEFFEFFNPMRALTLNNSPKFKNKSIVIETKDGTSHIEGEIYSVDESKREITFKINTPPIRVKNLIFLLIKFAISILPANRFDEIQNIARIISRKSDKLDLEDRLFFIWGRNRLTEDERKVELYERTSNLNYPKYFLSLQCEKFFFQVFLPYTSLDNDFKNIIMNTEPFKMPLPKRNHSLTSQILYIDKIIPKKVTPLTITVLDSQKFNDFIELYKV